MCIIVSNESWGWFGKVLFDNSGLLLYYQFFIQRIIIISVSHKYQDIKIEIVELMKKVINYRTFEEKFPVGKEIKTD